MKLLLVCTTVGQAEEARRIAAAAVERGLAACVHIDAIESVYRWQGAVAQDAEFRLLLKTPPARYAALEAALRERHPYALPAIHAIATVQAESAYAAWVQDSTSP